MDGTQDLPPRASSVLDPDPGKADSRRAQGPLTEELVFRSCIVAVSHAAGFSKSQIVFLSPVYFGFGQLSCFAPNPERKKR